MKEYKYIINVVYDDEYDQIDTRKAKTLEDAYQFMTKWYLAEEKILSQAKFWEKYPFDKVKDNIEKYGFFNFDNEGDDDIQTMEFYIDKYMKEVY